MAALAIVAELIEVHVINFVAAYALRRCLFEIIPAVALRAGNRVMLTQQRECGGTVIKLGLPPARAGVTIVALFPLASFVHIICPVTADAGLRCIAIWRVGGVALFAGNGLVLLG